MYFYSNIFLSQYCVLKCLVCIGPYCKILCFQRVYLAHYKTNDKMGSNAMLNRMLKLIVRKHQTKSAFIPPIRDIQGGP